MPLRDTLLDQFTLTEVLRLHLMSSGARANSKNARFRYQQRGGYSSLDDPGVELRKQDSGLLKKLQAGNIFDFSPGWAQLVQFILFRLGFFYIFFYLLSGVALLQFHKSPQSPHLDK